MSTTASNPEPKMSDPTISKRSEGAIRLLRRGFAATPELRAGLRSALALAITVALGRLVVPIALQQVLDKGLNPEDLNIGFVIGAAVVSTVLIAVMTVVIQRLNLRVMSVAEQVLYGLRTRAFAHVHRLSLAAHNETKRGVLVARVTSDVETLAQFASWGAMSWVINLGTIIVVFTAIAVYSPPIALVVFVALFPILPLFRMVQGRQLRAYEGLRDSVSETMSQISEMNSALPLVRAYGFTAGEERVVNQAIDGQLSAQLKARYYFAMMFPISDFFGGVVLAAVTGVGVWFAADWGLTAGTLVTCLVLTNMLMQPVAELGEVLDQTQTALSGWKKILGLLDEPVDIVEPAPDSAVNLASGPIAVDLEGVWFAYDEGEPVLRSVDLCLPAGSNVAIVGQTGSGKSTLSKLLIRLADPDRGVVRLNGTDLRQVSADSRHHSIRLVPQDGFLFNATIAENMRMGRADATDTEIVAAFESLGLADWLGGLPSGIETEVGQRGEEISVGERQLVALARAQLSDPGLLLLDEATSNVDPETEQSIGRALAVLSEGRTTISVAHRLSTAEAADLVVVVERGEVVQFGPHAELVDAPGIYQRLYRSWIGNTRGAATDPAVS